MVPFPQIPRVVPLLVSLALATAGCRSNARLPSLWPPDDFSLEVREESGPGEGTGGPGRTVRSFRVWADGLAILLESRAELPGLPWSQPVFDSLAVYRLDPLSTRALCRGLQRAGLFEESPRRAQNDAPIEPSLSIRWAAMGSRGFSSLRSHARSEVERALEVVAGFLPDGIRFLDVPPDLARVSDVPQPRRSPRDAVLALRDVARERPDDFALLLDLYVVAVAARDWRAAREALTELQNDRAVGALGDGDAELLDWRKEALPRLRALLPER